MNTGNRGAQLNPYELGADVVTVPLNMFTCGFDDSFGLGLGFILAFGLTISLSSRTVSPTLDASAFEAAPSPCHYGPKLPTPVATWLGLEARKAFASVQTVAPPTAGYGL